MNRLRSQRGSLPHGPLAITFSVVLFLGSLAGLVAWIIGRAPWYAAVLGIFFLLMFGAMSTSVVSFKMKGWLATKAAQDIADNDDLEMAERAFKVIQNCPPAWLSREVIGILMPRIREKGPLGAIAVRAATRVHGSNDHLLKAVSDYEGLKDPAAIGAVAHYIRLHAKRDKAVPQLVALAKMMPSDSRATVVRDLTNLLFDPHESHAEILWPFERELKELARHERGWWKEKIDRWVEIVRTDSRS